MFDVQSVHCLGKAEFHTRCQEKGFQVSAQPPAKKTAGQIEKETNEHRTLNVQLAEGEQALVCLWQIE
jgi:hypothetical protein